MFELNVNEATKFLLYTEPAIYQFCHGLGGGFRRFLRICREGKFYRWKKRQLPDPPRLLVEQWQSKLIGKRLVDADAEPSEDVSSLLYLPLFQLSLPKAATWPSEAQML